MKVAVIIDNLDNYCCKGEWGLSLYIEYNQKKILLDTGSTSLFIENAKQLNIDLKDIDYGVLSHAHYDHSGGMSSFFEINNSTNFYIQSACEENCYSLKDSGMEYIGIEHGLLEKYKDRIIKVDGIYKLFDGAYLVPHQSDCSSAGRKANMFVKIGEEYLSEKFLHEQSLVLKSDKGLVVFNSCSHSGADKIIDEIEDVFKGEKIYALIGGFHLYKTSEEDVRTFANRLKDKDVERIITGHCTGDIAANILKEIIKDKVDIMYSGKWITL